MGRRSLGPHTARALAEHFGTAPFTYAEAASVGITRDRILGALRTGHVTRDHVGVFRTLGAAADLDMSHPHPGVSAADASARALAHRLEGSALSHVSASRWQGLPVPRGTSHEGHITLPGTRARLVASVRVHASALPTHHVTMSQGVRVTTPARTAIDIARTSTHPEALICMDAAMRRLIQAATDGPDPIRMAVHDRHLIDRSRRAIHSILDDMPGWPGTANARRALHAADPASESALESQSRGLLIEHGVPAPECGFPIEGANGSIYWADMAWPEARVAGECDGLMKYEDSTVLYREKLRQEAIEQAGWRVVRWTYNDILRSPLRVVERVVRAMGMRAA